MRWSGTRRAQQDLPRHKDFQILHDFEAGIAFQKRKRAKQGERRRNKAASAAVSSGLPMTVLENRGVWKQDSESSEEEKQGKTEEVPVPPTEFVTETFTEAASSSSAGCVLDSQHGKQDEDLNDEQLNKFDLDQAKMRKQLGDDQEVTIRFSGKFRQPYVASLLEIVCTGICTWGLHRARMTTITKTNNNRGNSEHARVREILRRF